MTEKRGKPFDAPAINPRYKGAKMSDVARALVTDPKVRARLEERWNRRSVTPENGADDGSGVTPPRIIVYLAG